MEKLNWAGARGEKWRRQYEGMEGMLTPVDETLFRALNVTGPCRIADIGCGAGGTTLKLQQFAPRGSVVHGYDISPGLIEVAKSRTAGAAEPKFYVADLATAPAPDPAYDRMMSRFSTMFFEDEKAAFANLLHWLSPGGRFAFAVWGAPADNPWMTIVRDSIGEIVPLAPEPADAPGMFRYANPETLLGLLAAAGFNELESMHWNGLLAMGNGLSPAQAAQFSVTSFANFEEQLSNAGPNARADATQLLASRFEQHQRDGVVQMEARVNIVTGTRPNTGEK